MSEGENSSGVTRNEDILPDVRPLTNEIRQEIIKDIELFMLNIGRQAITGSCPTLGSRQGLNAPLRFSVKASRRKIALIIFTLSKIHRLLTTNSTCSRREFYYERVDLFRSQRRVDETAKQVSELLQRPPWHLSLTATSKGLIAGDMVIVTGDGNRLKCDAEPTGLLIPKDVLAITSFQTSARFVLVVEKDTVFQKLLQDDAPTRLGHCLLVTGKGYPDVNTRLLLWRLQKDVNIPLFAMVDADPHGIEIMWTYRCGPTKIPGHLTAPALPSLRWLGLHPSDIVPLGLLTNPLTPEDRRLAGCLLHRTESLTDSKCAEAIKQQVQVILSSGRKAEIESLAQCARHYLVDVYVPSKINNEDYI